MNYADHTFALDSLDLDGTRYLVEKVRGTAAVAARRHSGQRIAFRHGTWDEDDPYTDEKILNLRISIHAVDEYGEQPYSPYHHLRENFEDLAAVLGKRGRIDVRQYLPEDPDESGSDPIELQNYARVRRQLEIGGDALVWYMDIELVFAYPYWHELPQISLASDTSHVIETGGSAPIADMVLTFAGDGTLSDDQGHEISISGSSGAATVDVGAREVTEGGSLAMSLLDLGSGTPEYWMEWPTRTTVNLTSDVGVAVDYFRARQ